MAETRVVLDALWALLTAMLVFFMNPGFAMIESGFARAKNCVNILCPVVGHWIWGGGWLQKRGMFDFAGSTVVHSVGGWAALAGVAALAPLPIEVADAVWAEVERHALEALRDVRLHR